VGEFIREAGGVAGINGTFFADARLRGTDATMIGPCITSNDGEFVPDMDEYRLTRLVNRPVVLLSPKKMMIVPFQPGYMSSETVFKAALPELTDMFLAGAWIVHDGVARTEEQLKAFSASDFAETRRRAFFGITATGEVVVGGTLEVVSTMKMAEAAAAAGVQEAVLLDSGFSTSVIYDNKIIVTGHTAEHIPSRPVPHAIVLSGTLEPPTDPALVTLLQEASTAIDPEGTTIDNASEEPRPRRRRRRRSRRSTPSQSTTSSTGTGTPSAASGPAPDVSSTSPPDNP
jgi:poly-beta-1,6-N-acetyl-D-glucosamine N-deacetylase